MRSSCYCILRKNYMVPEIKYPFPVRMAPLILLFVLALYIILKKPKYQFKTVSF